MAAVGIALLFVLLIAGTPIGVALLAAGAIGITLISGPDAALGVLKTMPLSMTQTYELVAVPMFILMAEFIVVSGIADDLFRVATIWVGRVRGGLAISTAIAGAGLGAICGSSTASAATLSSTSIPAMISHGYKPHFACGVVAISGTLAMLIPPSIAVIIYGLIAEENIGKLLIACVVPGLIVTAGIILTIMLIGMIVPDEVPFGQPYRMLDKLKASKIAFPIGFLFMTVTGVIYLGVATPTEAASAGAAGALALATIARKMTFRGLFEALKRTVLICCMLILIVIGANVFSSFVALTRITHDLVAWTLSFGLPPEVLIWCIVALYLVLGCFLDAVAILVLTIPVVLPIVKGLGFDPIWFGVIAIVTIEVGMVTPPVGMNAFVVARVSGRPLVEVFKGVWPHVAAHILILILLVYFPRLSTWLPDTMR